MNLSSTTPRNLEALIVSTVRSGEQTEAHIFAQCERLAAPEQIDSAIERLLDAGKVSPTVIDGGSRFGFLPGLRLC